MSEDKETVQWLAEARRGGQGGMGRLAVLVRERLHAFVFRMTLDHDATEDIIQETLLAMVGRLHTLHNDDRFWPWIYRIAWSRTQDRFRRRRLQSTYTTVVLRESAAERNDSVLDAQIHEETLRQLSRAIDQLNRREQDVLLLRYYEQLPYTEIASRTSVTPELARVHSHRAKKLLKRQLACCL